jgi:predicted PurR-regulated permease PerM
MNTKIEITLRTIVLTLGVLLGIWVLYQIRDILFLLFIAFLLMTAIQPLVVFLERYRVPRALGILLVYAVVFGFFGASLVGAIPALVAQSTRLATDLPAYISKMMPYWNIDVSTISQQVAPIGERVVKVTLGIFSNMVTLVTVLVFTFYFLIERRHADVILKSFIGEAAGDQVLTILRSVERRLGSWVRGELLLMSFVGILCFIGLTILRVDYALPLAILAGVLEVVPMIGPTVSAIPAILVALSISPFLALSVVALYIIVQQVENNILVPLIMRKSVGFAPIVTILALMIGGRLAGVVGAILAVPVALVVQELITILLVNSKMPGLKSAKNPSK